MKKKVLSILLCLVMVIGLLPTVALAATATSVTVGGVELSSAAPYWKNGDTTTATGTASDYNAYFNAAAGVLTLKDAAIRGADCTDDFSIGIYAEGDLTVTLVGSSTVTGGTVSGTGDSIGIYIENGLINGTGSLTAVGGAGTKSAGIYGGAIEIAGDAAVTAVGGAATTSSCGVCSVNGNVTLSGGKLTAVGNNYGVSASGAITYTGGLLVAKGGTSAMNKAATDGAATPAPVTVNEGWGAYDGKYVVYGDSATYHVHGSVWGTGTAAENHIVWTGNDLALTNTIIIAADNTSGDANALNTYAKCKLTLSGYNVALAGNASGASRGVSDMSGQSMTIDGTGTLVSIGGKSTSNSYGVYGVSLTIEDGTLIAVGGTASSESSGIRMNGPVSIKGGTVTTIGGAGTRGNGLSCSYGVTVTNGAVTAIGGSAYYTTSGTGDSNGIYAWYGSININGGVVTAIGGTGKYSCGVSGDNSISITGGSGTAIAGNGTDQTKAMDKAPPPASNVTTTGVPEDKVMTWVTMPTPAEILAATLNAIAAGTCKVESDGKTVTMLKNAQLTDTISITTGAIVLDLNGFTITGKAGAGAAAISVSGTANVTIQDSGTTGSIVGGSGAYPRGTGGTGLSVSETGTVTMSGGTCKGGVGGDAASVYSGGIGGVGLSVSGSGSVELSGGTFQGGDGGQGGTVKGHTGYAISATSISALISSGYGAYDNAATPAKIADADLAAATYISIQKVPTPAETLAAALNAAYTAGGNNGTCCKVESDGQTVTMLKDVTLNGTTEITGGPIVLDLAGKTITGTAAAGWADFDIAATGNLTVKDSVGGGKLSNGGNGGQTISISGTLTVLSGTIEATNANSFALMVQNGGTVTLSGGTFIGSTAAIGGTVKLAEGYAFKGGTDANHLAAVTDYSNVKYLAVEPATYAITLPATQTGYTLAAKTGSASPVTHGGSYTFTLTLDADYNESSPVVKVNETAVTLDANGEYTISNITSAQTIKVEGVVKNFVAPTIGTVSLGTDTFKAGKNYIETDFASYKPTVTENSGTITAQGWQYWDDNETWFNFHVPGIGDASMHLLADYTYKLRYFVTYTDNASVAHTIFSNEVTMDVVRYETALALAVDPQSPQSVNTSVTLTATLTGYWDFAGLNGQSVTFKCDGNSIGTAGLGSNGVATIEWTPTVSGTYSLTAEYDISNSHYNAAATATPVSYKVLELVDENLDMTTLVTAPVKNGTPQSVFADQPQYTATIAWSGSPSLFLGGTAYTATVTLTAKEGYSLAGLSADSFSHTGASSVTFDPATGVATLVFPATSAKTATAVAVTGTPAKTIYNIGETFVPAGLIVTVTYDDGTSQVFNTATGYQGLTITPAIMAADTASVTFSYGGVQSEAFTGLTVRENLTSITAPDAKTGISNGAAKTAAALRLPATVRIVTSTGATTMATVTWDVEAADYNPASLEGKTFTVNGVVTLPADMTNLNDVTVGTQIRVTVKAAALVPTPAQGTGTGDTAEHITGITTDQQVLLGTTMTITADEYVRGDKTYIPAAWATNPSGVFTPTGGTSYSATVNTTGMTAGAHTFTITYREVTTAERVATGNTVQTQIDYTTKTASDSSDSDVSTPTTGDTSTMALWVALLFVSGGALTAFGVSKKRKKTDGK